MSLTDKLMRWKIKYIKNIEPFGVLRFGTISYYENLAIIIIGLGITVTPLFFSLEQERLFIYIFGGFIIFAGLINLIDCRTRKVNFDDNELVSFVLFEKPKTYQFKKLIKVKYKALSYSYFLNFGEQGEVAISEFFIGHNIFLNHLRKMGHDF